MACSCDECVAKRAEIREASVQRDRFTRIDQLGWARVSWNGPTGFPAGRAGNARPKRRRLSEPS